MASRVLEVILQAKDAATAVIGKVEGSLKTFGSGVGRVTKNVSDSLNSMMGRWLTVGGIGAILSKAVSASNEFEASVRKLAGTAKIAGVPLEFLQDISNTAQKAFGLSAITANDMTVAVGKLAAKAGDLNMTGDLLERFLDLGAAKGLSAAETLKAVEQSILGIDEGTDKLFGANPSVLYKEFADAIGTTAGKLTDQEKAMAIATATMRDGGKVVGAYNDYLQSTAGQLDQASQAGKRAAVTLGQVLAPAVKWVADAVETMAGGVEAFVGGLQLWALDIGEWAQGIGPNLKIVAGALMTFLGDVFDNFRDLPIIGDKFGELADRLRTTGREMVTTNRMFLKELTAEVDKERAKIVAIEQSTGKKLVLETRKTGVAVVEEDKETAKEREKVAEEIAVKTLQVEQGLTEAQAKEVVRRRGVLKEGIGATVSDLREGYAKIDQLNLLLAAGFNRDIVPAMKRTELAMTGLRDAAQDLPPAAKAAGAAIEDVGKKGGLSLEDGARAAIGFFGRGPVGRALKLARDGQRGDRVLELESAAGLAAGVTAVSPCAAAANNNILNSTSTRNRKS
jgi:hypothetical protein